MLIIPAIDIYENKVVRLKKGNFNEITYYDVIPLEQAKLYNEYGFEWIHIVDLTGSKYGEVTILNLLKDIKEKTDMKIEFGGGIRDKETAQTLFDAGVDKIVIGSLSIKNKPLFEDLVNSYTPGKIISAIDVRNEMISVNGWIETSTVSLTEHITYCMSLGITEFLCTDIAKDGMLEGTNVTLYEKLMLLYPNIKVIASGGVKDIDDIKKLMLKDIYGVVVGKAIYEGKIELKELSLYNNGK